MSALRASQPKPLGRGSANIASGASRNPEKIMIKRIFKKYGRAYIDESTGVIYPGVTTILDIMDKRLDYWKMMQSGNYIKEEVCKAHEGVRLLDWVDILKESKKAPDKYRDSKGAQGTRIHKVIERELNGEDISADLRDDAKLTAIMVQIRKWIKENKLEPILVEGYLLSKTYRYAGAVDLVAKQNTPEHGEQTVLVDFKTGKSIQDVAKWQLAAYCNAFHEQFGGTIDIAFIQHISYDNQIIAEASHLHKEEINTEFEKFLHIYGAFKARWERELQ